MSEQSKAQQEYVRDLRIQNSLLYQAKATKPRSLQNIDVILKTMQYNNLDDNLKSGEALKAKAKNTRLLLFTALFEVMVGCFRVLGFLCGAGRR